MNTHIKFFPEEKMDISQFLSKIVKFGKIYKDNEKKFRFIQEEGIELEELFSDIDDNINDTIDEIYEKESTN